MIDTNKLYAASNAVFVAVEYPVAKDLAELLRKAADEIATLRGVIIRIRDGHPDIDNPEDDASWCRSMAHDAIAASLPAEG